MNGRTGPLVRSSGLDMTTRQGPLCISVINMKGGVGKTTIAALLSRYASDYLGINVLAIDLDPQANLSQAFMGDSRYRQFLNDRSTSIVEIFNGYQPPTSISAAAAPLDAADVTVTNTTLGGPNLELIPSRFDFSDNKSIRMRRIMDGIYSSTRFRIRGDIPK